MSTSAEPEPEYEDDDAQALLDQVELSHPDLVVSWRAEIANRLAVLYQDADSLVGELMDLRGSRCGDTSCTACMAHNDRRDAAALIAQAVRALNGARALIRPTIEGTP